MKYEKNVCSFFWKIIDRSINQSINWMDIENNLCFSIENMKHEQRILSGQTVNICNDGR